MKLVRVDPGSRGRRLLRLDSDLAFAAVYAASVVTDMLTVAIGESARAGPGARSADHATRVRAV